MKEYYSISATYPRHSVNGKHKDATIENNIFGSYDIKEVKEEIQYMKESDEYTNITIITTQEY